MTRRILSLTFVFIGLCVPASAQNWVDQFLSRWRAGALEYPSTLAVTQDTLPNLIRNGQIPLSIQDLITLTLQNNLDITVDRLAPLTSEYAVLSNYRPFEPTLNLSASVTRDTSQSQTQLTGVTFVSQLSHAYTIGFAKSLTTGGEVAVDFILNRSSSNNAFNTFNPVWYGTMRYRFSHNVLNGFGSGINTRSIRIARNNKTISDTQFETQVIDMITQAQKTYWDLVFTSEDLKVKQDSLDLAQKTLADNEIQVQVGTLARIDLVQARSQVSTRQEELIVADYTQTQIQDQIKKLVTRQPDPGLVLAKVMPTQPAALPGDQDILPVEAAIRVALENRPELRRANLEMANSEIELQYAKNQLLPTLSISAQYLQNGVGGPQTIRSGFAPNAPIIAVIPGGIGDMFAQLLRSNTGGYTLGFDMQIPLSNRAAQAEYSRVTTVRRTAEENIKALEQQIALEVRNAVTAVQMNKARIEAAQRSRELADEQYMAEQRKFELGASTVRFVLEEQTTLEQAQTNEISALVNYQKALVDYDRALGMTLMKNNVSIEKTVAALR